MSSSQEARKKQLITFLLFVDMDMFSLLKGMNDGTWEKRCERQSGTLLILIYPRQGEVLNGHGSAADRRQVTGSLGGIPTPLKELRLHKSLSHTNRKHTHTFPPL